MLERQATEEESIATFSRVKCWHLSSINRRRSFSRENDRWQEHFNRWRWIYVHIWRFVPSNEALPCFLSVGWCSNKEEWMNSSRQSISLDPSLTLIMSAEITRKSSFTRTRTFHQRWSFESKNWSSASLPLTHSRFHLSSMRSSAIKAHLSLTRTRIRSSKKRSQSNFHWMRTASRGSNRRISYQQQTLVNVDQVIKLDKRSISLRWLNIK